MPYKNIEDRRKRSKYWREKHPEHLYTQQHNRLQELKREVLTHYGFGNCACVRCGFDDLRALSLDHIEGKSGSQDNGRYGNGLYAWTRDNDYPAGYLTLCMNCQVIKRIQNREFGRQNRMPKLLGGNNKGGR